MRIGLVTGAFLCAPLAHGQSVRPTRIIVGSVHDATGKPVSAATIVVRAAGSDSVPTPVSTRSDSAGRYALRWTGSSALATVSRIGYIATAQLLTLTASAGDTLRHDVTLNALSEAVASTTTLPTVTTTARRKPNENRNLTAGENRSGSFATTQIALPITPGSLTEMAAGAPGAMLTPSGEDGAATISLAGQSPNQNHTSVDGASSQNNTLPAEALASSSVVTSAYDVSIGQFTGGELRATTRAGTNVWGAAVRGGFVPGALAYGGSSLVARRDAPTTYRVDGGGGGPLVFDRVFGYAALSLSKRDAPARFLDNGGASLLGGTATDSILRRFPAILRQLGVPLASDPLRRAILDNLSAMARLDFAVDERHLITVRLDGRSTHADNVGSSPIALSAGAASTRASNAGILGAWSWQGVAFGNELKLSGSRSDRSISLGSAGPQVSATALLPGSAIGAAALRFGGNPLGVDAQRQPFLEISDEVTWLSPHGTNLWRLGVIANDDRIETERRSAARGSVSYASLDDLAAERASFYSYLAPTTLRASVRYGALFLGNTWSPTEAWRITYGMRSEWASYDVGSRAASPVMSAGDSRKPPRDVALLPRIGASYYGRTLTVNGGVGLFRGSVRASMLSGAAGDAVGSGRVECVGASIPSFALADLFSHAEDAPRNCASGGSGLSSTLPRAAVFASDFGAPRSLRASLNIDWQIYTATWIKWHGSYASGYHEPTALDQNFNAMARFSLGDEARRPVFVDPSTINTADGSTSLANSRLNPAAGSTMALGSSGRSRALQLSAGFEGLTPWRGAVTMWYTFTSARDATNGFSALDGSSPSTSGEPRERTWGPRDFTPAHLIQITASHRVVRLLNLTLIGRLASGVSFTPMVAGDINGDGLSNDRAFVFDASRTRDPVLAAAMSQLLNSAPTEVRNCLKSQLGQIAARGSCQTPWSPALDAQINLGPHAWGGGMITVMLTAQNITSGLDYALHGPEHLRGWGQFAFADDRLLQRVGYDAAAQAFRYQVNPSFGTTGSIRAGRAPFTLSLQVRVALADPARQLMNSIAGAAMSGREAAATTQRFLARRFPDVAGRTMASVRSWSLDLSESQVKAIASANDSIGAPLRLVVDSLQALLQRGSGLSREDAALLRVLTAQADELAEAGRRAVQRALTERQWLRLPPPLRESQTGTPMQPSMTIRLPNP
jgi:hypothetical protein